MELISNNGYGLCFMKLGGALTAKIIDIDRQKRCAKKLISCRNYFKNKIKTKQIQPLIRLILIIIDNSHQILIFRKILPTSAIMKII